MKRFVIFHILFLVIINLYAFEDLSKEEMQYLSVNKEIIFTGQTNYQPFEFLNDKEKTKQF